MRLVRPSPRRAACLRVALESTLIASSNSTFQPKPSRNDRTPQRLRRGLRGGLEFCLRRRQGNRGLPIGPPNERTRSWVCPSVNRKTSRG